MVFEIRMDFRPQNGLFTNYEPIEGSGMARRAAVGVRYRRGRNNAQFRRLDRANNQNGNGNQNRAGWSVCIRIEMPRASQALVRQVFGIVVRMRATKSDGDAEIKQRQHEAHQSLSHGYERSVVTTRARSSLTSDE